MAETQEFNVSEELRKRNEAAAGKAPLVPTKTEELNKTEPDKEERPSRSEKRLLHAERRAQNELREQIGELRGKLQAYEEMGLKPKPAEVPRGAEDPEPQRKDFANDGDYNRALGRWDARQEAGKLVAKVEEKQTQESQLNSLREEIAAAEERAQAEIKELFPDWDEVSKAAQEDDDAPEFVPAEHPLLMMMLARSDMKARILYHWAKNPEALESLLEMKGDQNKLFPAFHRLEGRVEKLYDAIQEPKKDDKPTKAERDAALPKPSESVTARGGTGDAGEPAMLLADGKTLNPAWKARQNAKAGVRP